MRRVVLEITRTSLRALAVEGPLAQPRIRRFVVEPLDGEPSSQMLRRLLAGLRPARARVLVAIPREQVITRLVKFPATSLNEIAQMVELSGKAQLPFPPDQAVADFSVVDQHGGASQVQLVACHRDLVDRHMNLLRGEGIELAFLVPSSWAVFAWYQRLGRSSQAREPVMVVNVDIDRTDLALIAQGRLLFSRSLSQGLREWQAGPEGLTPLAEELERSLSSLRKELPGTDAASLLLSGLGPLDQWKSIFEQRLAKPVVVKTAQGALRMPKTEGEVNASQVVALGLAMADTQWLINLLPREARQAQQHRRRTRELILAGTLLLASLLLGSGLLLASVRRQEQLVSQITQALKALETLTKQTERQERDVNLIEAVLELRRWTKTMLAKLLQLTPPEVFFESLVFERPRGELVVRGGAQTTRQVLDYIRNLEQSGQWDRVELRYSARRSVFAGTRTDFEIVLRRGSTTGQ